MKTKLDIYYVFCVSYVVGLTLIPAANITQ